MARASDQFRQSDVTFWGIVALVTGGVALLVTNLSAVVPDSVFAALHATRLTGASVNEMHAELASLEDAQNQMTAANRQLINRFENTEHDAIALGQRISALEVSVPKLTEALNARSQPSFDPSIITGSIGGASPGFVKPAPPAPSDTASVKVTMSPYHPGTLGGGGSAVAGAGGSAVASLQATPVPVTTSAIGAGSNLGDIPQQPMPQPLAPPANTPAAPPRGDVMAEGAITPSKPPTTAAPAQTASADATALPPATGNTTAIGVAIGPAVQPAAALQAWQNLAARVGIMLVGTSPLLSADPAGSNGKVLVAGPLPSIAVATQLCTNIGHAGISCMPMPYVGEPLGSATTAQ